MSFFGNGIYIYLVLGCKKLFVYACVLMPLAYRLLWRPGGVRAGVADLNLPL